MTLIPNNVTFRGVSHSAELDAEVEERIEALAHFYPRIVRCRVLVEVPHRHRRDGTQVHVRIELTLPGSAPLLINRQPSLHSGLKDIQEPAHRKDADIGDSHRHARVAIREAFEAARRRLEEFAREQRGDVKTHPTPSRLSRAPRARSS